MGFGTRNLRLPRPLREDVGRILEPDLVGIRLNNEKAVIHDETRKLRLLPLGWPTLVWIFTGLFQSYELNLEKLLHFLYSINRLPKK